MEHIEDGFGLIRNLRAARFKLKLQPIETTILPEYKGSTIRGVLGWRLRKVICVNQEQKDCSECLLVSKCLFNYLFSPKLPPNTQFLQNSSDIPSPILIEPPLTKKRIFEAGEQLDVGLVLIGKGLEYLPYLVYVFTEIGRCGIGQYIHERNGRKYGGRFRLEQVWDDVGDNLIYSADHQVLSDNYKVIDWTDAQDFSRDSISQITLNLLTPVRIIEMKQEKKCPSRLSGFGQIIANLYWRMVILAYFHCNPWKLDDERFKALPNEAAKMRKQLALIDDVRLEENRTFWQNNARWSNRKAQKMNFSGFMGQVSFFGNLTSYLPLLYLGQYLHLGKQTMFGMGKYELSTYPAPEDTNKDACG